MVQILGVGIDDDEIYPLDFRINHMIDSVFTRTADANDLNPRKRLNFRVDFRHIGFRLAEKN